MSFIKDKDILEFEQIKREVCERNLVIKRKSALHNIPLNRIMPISPYPEFKRSELDMRRKVEILKYQNNATNTKTNNFSKKQQWSMLVNGVSKNQSQVKIKENNSINCPLDEFIPKLTTASDVPGNVIMLQYNPSIPLYNYVSNVNV